MIKFHKVIATVCGIGYIGKGGGTIAAVVYCILLMLLPAGDFNNYRQVCITVLVCIAGVWSGNAVDAIWGKDSSKVVIDEVAGMMVTLIFFPVNLKVVLTGLVLFRFFDIIKPFYIKKMELLPKGWGVMADDLLAGLYAHLILYITTAYKIV